MDITKRKKSRNAIRRVFTSTKEEIVSLVGGPKDSLDIIKVKAAIEVLDSHYQALLKEDTVIYEALLEQNTPDKEFDKELNSQKQFSMEYQFTKKTVEQLLNEQDNPSVASTIEGSQNQRMSQVGLDDRASCSYKLPMIKIKEFGGDLKDWLPFWSQFSKIDSNQSITASDKMQYLIMATLPNSTARKVVDSYPATDDMYPEVIKALKARFGRDDLLTEYYIRELLQIIISNASSSAKLSVAELYDKLQCHLRNLDTLGVSANTCAPILLPLVSSCLPEDVLKLWERSRSKLSTSNESSNTSKDLLEDLLGFLRGEIEGEQKVRLAMSGFGLSSPNSREKGRPNKFSVPTSNVHKQSPSAVSTATGLCAPVKHEKNTVAQGCLFCSLSHKTQDCIKAQSMTMEERKSIVNDKRACFCCLKPGHPASKCRYKPRCIVCKKSHFVIMCSSIGNDSKQNEPLETGSSNTQPKTDEALANSTSSNVLMQTLQVNVRGPNGISCTVRALIDSASQRSYILSSTATKVGYEPTHQENLQHSLFGGNSTNVICHNAYVVHLSSLDNSYGCHFEVLDQHKICGKVSPVVKGPWIDELAVQNIKLSDLGSPAGPIEILIGADVAGKLWTGGYKRLECGLVSVETKLGWTLMGKVPGSHQTKENLAALTTTMLTTEAKITDLWNLDSLGILDPCEKVAKHELELETERHFLDTVTITDEGRFEVSLPWIENHPPLPDNYQLAKKRLSSTVKKLNNEGLFETYEDVFKNWKEEGIIEEVPKCEIDRPAHYLPHRHVLKLESTTPVRPVFDASAHEYKSPSLNQCLDKGPNLIEKIPSVVARFRLKEVGVIGDIRKAFLQISLNEKDRDFLRFLWMTREEEMKVFRHCRVVFGVSSSPFLLEASIKLHLKETLLKCERGELNWPINVVQTLASSFYVDNCVCSLENNEQTDQFIRIATEIMSERKFELRGWEKSLNQEDLLGLEPLSAPVESHVLGLIWNRSLDTLEVSVPSIQEVNSEKITKRMILSTAHRIFDPIGFTSCVSLVPKLLMQRTWEKGINWDQEVDLETKKSFLTWYEDLSYLSQVKIPRWLGTKPEANKTLHVFSDASQVAYASVAFLRVEEKNNVHIQLIAAKSRVAPVSKSSKKMTIPRLELLAASISARLYKTIVIDYELDNVKTYFWSDATTVLAWIEREHLWNVFVNNRVTEIRNLTVNHEWRYVPGDKNPADLPSRGCSAQKLHESRWCEGPQWLKEEPQYWPKLDTMYDEDNINNERRKTVISAISQDVEDGWFHGGCSSYTKTVRMIGWCNRFKNNTLKKEARLQCDLTAEEFKLAEDKLLLLVQEESFSGVTDPKLSTLIPFVDDKGLIRVKTKISNREDANDFCYPIVLPSSKHPIVFRLIKSIHSENCHVGSQMIMSILRQRFWILGGRRTVKSVLSSCVICKRHTSKKVESIPTPLPLDRVRNAKVFEIIGVDLAGPLFLKTIKGKENVKAWVCLFTCSVYRAVHFELLSSLSTDSFIMSLRRFIARRGRPITIYSDHGTNFHGADNALKNLDWSKIEQYSSVRKIQWKYSPPTGPWWGGWWERLIGVLKKLLRRVLGNSHINQEEMQTILCDCEAIVNSRPLTYVSDDHTDLTPLTPNLFLQDVEEIGIPDLDLVEASDLNQRLKYRQELKKNLMERFRTEYLGQLQLHANKCKLYELTVGEIVLIGNDGIKRLNWPLARIVELIKGKDGNIRLARLKTAKGELVRPVQRIFPLEIKSNPQETEIIQMCLQKKKNEEILKDIPNEDPQETLQERPTRCTRKGRIINLPKKFED